MTARVGLIIPSSNRMVEAEMVPAFPAGVAAHVTRLRMTGTNHLAFDQLLPRIEDAARALTDARCDVVVFHCTANSMEGGKTGEEQILATLAQAGAPRVDHDDYRHPAGFQCTRCTADRADHALQRQHDRT